MTADEIRKNLSKFVDTGKTCEQVTPYFLCEIAAQLAELNEKMEANVRAKQFNNTIGL
jgi:hypothetical protein